MKKEYLGDSVYCELDKGMIKLTTENGYGPSNTIFLESEVMDALLGYYERAVAWAEFMRKENKKKAAGK